jgi:glutathione S-transferase
MHKLTGIAFSHFVEKARWALDRFAVPYEDQRVLPFFHFPAVYLLHRGKLGRSDRASSRFSTPVLRTDDGRVLCDSAEIVHYVSDRFAPSGHDLYSTSGVAELEQHLHDEFGPHTRRLAYGIFFANPALLHQVAAHNVDPVQATLFRGAYPLIKEGLKKGLAIDDARVLRSTKKVLQEFDSLSARLADGRPYLLGDRFSAADLAFASLAAPALIPPEYSAWLPPLHAFPMDVQTRAQTLRETPAGALAMRLFREERRRVVRA